MNPIRHRGRRLAVSAMYDGAFTLKIDTTKAGSASDTFVLPCGTGVNFDGVVAWGDGTTTRLTGAPGDVTHVYPAAGIYIVRCWEMKTDGFQRVYFNNAGDKSKVLEIMQWGRNKWGTLQNAFFGCDNLVITAKDEAGARFGSVTNATYAFRGCTSMKRGSRLDLRACTTFTGMHNGCTALIETPGYNTQAATTLASKYYGCTALKHVQYMNSRLVQDWSLMHYNCSGLAGYDYPALDMSAITNGTNFMYGCAISKASYNSMLDQLANGRGGIPAAAATGVAFRCDAHYDGSTGGYDGTTARGYLTGTKTWTITDGGTP